MCFFFCGLLHKVRSYFNVITTACVNFSQPSAPPVTLIYSGARRTGILATEADIPTLFVLSHNACVCVCVDVHDVRECVCVLLYNERVHVRIHTRERLHMQELHYRNLLLACKAAPLSRL